MGPNTTTELFVSHLEKEGNFLKIWGQRDKEAVENVERMLLNLSEEFDQGKYMADPQHLHPDMLCCCRFDDGRYYRCKVLDVHLPSGMVYCHYLDYGNRNRVPFTNLRVAENYRMSLFRSPAQATSYILTGVVGSWSFQYLNKISEDILYGEHKCLVVKSAGQHSEIQLMKLFRDGVDYAEQLVQEKIAFPIPQDAFEVMIWTELAYPKSVPVTLPYQFPVMPLTVNQQWAPMCVAQPVPTISTYTVANGLRSSIPLPITSLPGEVISGPRPVKKSNPVQKPPATSFATIRLQDNSEHKVFVSHVDNGSLTFYAQLAENKDELNEMVAQLNDPSKQYTNLKQPFIPGTMCLAKYSEDDAIYRSIITSIDEDTCKVYFVDYGNCDIVKCVDMYEIPPEFTYPKAMAVPFGLSGLNKIDASDEMLEAFYNLALEEDCVLKVVPPKCEQLTTKQLAELFIDETNVKELINVEILQKKPKSKVVGFRNAPFPEAGSKVKVKVAYVKSIDRFFVQHAANSDDLQAVMDIVEQHCKGPARLLKESDIVPGAACCALFDEDWYRAMILEDHPELKVLYVDYGNEEVTQADQLRSASDVIVNKLVAQAIPCRLAEVQVNESLTAKFEDLVLEKLFTMHVVEVDQQGLCVVVKLFNEYGVDISDLLNPSEVIKAVSSNLNGSSQHSQNRGQSVNRPMPDINREYSENRVNGQSDNYTTRDRQEKSTHPAINTKVNSRTNQSHDASENYRTDPEAWGIGKGSRGGSMNGHCDRVDNLYREDSRSSSRISNSSYSNSRNRTEPEQSNCHDVSDSWDSPLSIPKWTVQLGSKTQVSVVFSTNPCDFYIHESGADSDNLQDLIEDHFPAGGKKLPDSLRTEGSVCVAKFLEDGCYYRAEIIKPTGAQTEVRFIDFGNVDMVDNNDLFVLEQNMTTQKAKAIHCRLIGVTQPEKWTEEDIKNFITVTESDQLEAEFIEVDDNLYSVILRETPISQSTINERFGATSETMMTKTTIVKSVKEQSPLALGCEHAVEVSWFETPGRFFVQKPSAEFTNMMKKIQMTYQNKQPLLNPVVGQAVVALFKGDGLLYRGEIKIEKGGKFGVHYMDYGNKALVDPSNIYGLENQFSSLPAQAILCELGNVLPVNGQWAKDPELSKLFQGQFTCSVLKTGESSTVVQLSRKGQDLSSQLVSMGMAAEPYVPSATSEPPVVAVTRDIPTVQAVSETTVPSEVVEVPGVNPQMMIGQFIQAIVLSIDDHSIFVTFEPSALMAIKDDVAKCVAQGLAKLPPRLVMPGTLCLVMDNCSEYKRAVIVDIKSTSGVAVKFLDSGCSEEIPSQNMFLLPDGLACIPALGHECCVMNVDTVNDLQPFIDQCVTLYVKSYDQGRFTGEVLDDCGQPFPFAPVHEVQVPSTILPMAILKQRIAVDIIYASDNSVWLHKAQDPTVAKLLDDMYETCEEGGDNLTSVTCGTLCAAKSEDGNWYRAIVESHSCDHAKVQFLDYGNSEDVPLKNLKVLNSFFNIPALAIKADLPIITEDGSNMGTTIMEMAEDKSFVAYFSRKGSQWLVELLDGKEVFSLKLIRTGRALSMENNPFPALMRKPQVSLQVGQTFTAELSFAESLSEFYVHLSSRSEELQKMESDLKSMPHCMKNVEDWPSVGSWVMAQYADDGLWYRGEVLPDKSIYFIDYGNVDKVDLQCLKVLPPALEDVDKLAVKCSLNPPNSKKWLAGAFDQFLQHVEAGAFSIKVKSHDNGCYSVDVIDSTRASVTDKLAESGFVEECQHESAEEQNDSPNEVFFNDKQGAEIVFSNSPSDFYVHLNRDAEMIQNIGEELEKANDFHTCEDFTEGKICAALFSEDDLWYRAQILSGQPGEINVRFIDYGNSSVVTQIKELPQHLLQIPPLAVHCTMPEPSKRTWSTSSCQLFTNLVESESNFHIELLSKEKPAKVNLWLDDVNVNQKLISDLKDVFDGCQDTKTCTIREEQHLDSKLEPQVAESKLLSIGESCKTLEIPLQDQNLADSDISDSTVSEEQHLDSYLEPHQADSSQLPETVESNDEIIAVCQPDHAVAAPDLIDNAVHEEQYADSYLERHRADLSPIPETEESKDQTIEICQSSHTSAAPDIIESCSAVPEEQCSDSHPEPHVADSSQILGIVESIEILQPDHTLPASDIIDSSVFEEQQSHSIEPHQAESNSIPDTDEGTGKILLSDETAGPNINFLNDGPMDTSNLGKTEDSLLNPLDDSTGIVSVGLEDDSVIDVTPEDNICVITLNDTVEEEGILNEITGETVSGKNDSIIEIDTVEKEGRLNEITGETVLGRNDSITEITLSEENVIDLTDESDEVTPPKGHTDLTSNEVLKGKNALTTSEESCFTCADSFKPSNIETDCKGHLTDQNLPSAIHAPKIVLPDSSTVDAEYPLVTGDFGNIEPDISEPECYSECPEKFVESTSYKNHSEKASEEDNCVGSSSNQEHSGKCIVVEDNRVHGKVNEIPESSSSQNIEELCDLECVEDAGKTVVTSKVVNQSTQDDGSEVVVTLTTYPDWKSCEFDINGTFHGQSLARAKDFESDFVRAIPGTKTFSFEECEHHHCSVEISTSTDNFAKTSSRD